MALRKIETTSEFAKWDEIWTDVRLNDLRGLVRVLRAADKLLKWRDGFTFKGPVNTMLNDFDALDAAVARFRKEKRK